MFAQNLSRQYPTACYSVHAPVDPSVMPRVMEIFAKRGLVPTRWHSSICGDRGGELQIDIQMTDLEPGLAERLAASMRQLFCVRSVLTSVKGSALSA